MFPSVQRTITEQAVKLRCSFMTGKILAGPVLEKAVGWFHPGISFLKSKLYLYIFLCFYAILYNS